MIPLTDVVLLNLAVEVLAIPVVKRHRQIVRNGDEGRFGHSHRATYFFFVAGVSTTSSPNVMLVSAPNRL